MVENISSGQSIKRMAKLLYENWYIKCPSCEEIGFNWTKGCVLCGHPPSDMEYDSSSTTVREDKI